jgi:peroxiredoxin (alkyl hydroperoxide reductase subunit C)
LYYPLSLGRNIAEIIRVFDALQTSDANACSTPANWMPGKPVMAPPPLSKKDADARVLNNGDLKVTDWYYAQRDLATPAAK